MAKYIQAVRGMRDILPAETPLWRHVEAQIRLVLDSYGYAEIRMPVIESTDLFKRSIGEVTDIVEKEMYTFQDRNGDSLTLRPEGTASCVRAGMEHGLLHNSVQRLWYQGPMFRHERPQKGRYRQFHQIGVEAYGMATPEIDAELILMTARFWRKLGLDNLELQLNSLGSSAERREYRTVLVAYLEQHRSQLDTDSLRRLDTNPLRILDSKNSEMQSLIEAAPTLLEQLGEESTAHFLQVQSILDAAGVKYVINTRLVRGLDYYSRTVFEWVTDALGAQGTICAGGRYDGLVEQLGGRSTPASGFALGLERLISLLETTVGDGLPGALDAYMVVMGDKAIASGMVLAEQLRDALPDLRLQVNCAGGSFKSQFKKADKSGASLALVLGESELEQGVCGVKWLRDASKQQTVPLDELATFLNSILNEL